MSTNPELDERAMTDFRRVTDEFSVSPQIELADIAVAKLKGA
jgi:protein tyrosine phosphatase (PTP) superfamily phosphohydrolase (DUF442 family)